MREFHPGYLAASFGTPLRTFETVGFVLRVRLGFQVGVWQCNATQRQANCVWVSRSLSQLKNRNVCKKEVVFVRLCICALAFAHLRICRTGRTSTIHVPPKVLEGDVVL